MRYEVRLPDGKLIGLYNGPANMPSRTNIACAEPLLKYGVMGNVPLNPRDEVQLKVRHIELERGHFAWLTTVEVPTLILRTGKRAWLNKVRGFRRI